MENLEKKSKLLSFILRHRPESANVSLDSQGYCEVKKLVQNSDISLPDLEAIVRTDEKGRYSLSENKLFVRANQGHSVSGVHIEFKSCIPPVALYHGTTEEAFQEIKKHGLLKMNRHHVHLSYDIDTAVSVASRRKKAVVVLVVHAKRMLADNFKFLISENNVYLVDSVPVKYLTIYTKN
jgi:putative RNA 2'-phosphotransferase